MAESADRAPMMDDDRGWSWTVVGGVQVKVVVSEIDAYLSSRG